MVKKLLKIGVNFLGSDQKLSQRAPKHTTTFQWHDGKVELNPKILDLWDPRDPFLSSGYRRTPYDPENLPGIALGPPVFLGIRCVNNNNNNNKTRE